PSLGLVAVERARAFVERPDLRPDHRIGAGVQDETRRGGCAPVVLRVVRVVLDRPDVALLIAERAAVTRAAGGRMEVRDHDGRTGSGDARQLPVQGLQRTHVPSDEPTPHY